MTDTSFERVWAAAEARLAAGRIPGYVAAARIGGRIEVRAGGRTALGAHSPPMREDTLFRIASITKPMGAALALSLVQDGALDLDDPIARWLPEAARPRVLVAPDAPLDRTTEVERPITVRHLLTATCGWGCVLEETPLQRAMIERGVFPGPLTPPMSGDDFVARVAGLPLAFQPGDGWLYDTGMNLLGVLLSRAMGRPLSELVAERITGPLGMADTSFWTADAERLATAYTPGEDGLEVLDPPDGVWSRPSAGLSGREALDLVAQRQEALPGQREAVVGPQLAAGDVDVDALLEVQELEHGERVALAVDRAQVVAGELEVGPRGQHEVVLPLVARQQRGGEVGAGDREADADVAPAVVAEARVDADVDRLARVGERPDPPADVDLLVAVEVDRVDGADHPALGLLDVRGDRGLAQRLGDDALEELVARLHPGPPLGDDRELEAARVLVELADQRVHARRRRRSGRRGCRARRGSRRRAGCGRRCHRGPSRAARRSRRRRSASATRRARRSAAPRPAPPRPSRARAAACDRRRPRSSGRRP